MLSSIVMARTLLEQRSAREDLLAPVASLAEPCWLILLQLFSADHADKRSIISIAKLLNVGIATAERYLRLLEQHGIVRLSIHDQQVTPVLQPSTVRAMENILDVMCQQSRTALDC